MKQDAAKDLVTTLPQHDQVLLFASRLRGWLVDDLNRSAEPVPDFTESRAKALLRATNLLDEPTRHSFDRLMENEVAGRLALYDLLQESELAEEEAVAALAATTAERSAADAGPAVEWLSLAVAAFAWKSGYPLFQFDPALPPDPYSPAGQVLKRAATYIRQQVQRSATERDKQGRALAYAASPASSLRDLQGDAPIAPLPPHFRPPIPVRYPEVASETLRIDPDQEGEGQGAAGGEPITITSGDLKPEEQTPSFRAPIRISGTEQPSAPTRVVTPDAAVSSPSDFSGAVRKRFGRGRPPMKTTKLRVVVQEMPDGPALYGLQVRVSCKGIRSQVAGTTTREGLFICELPVPEDNGLTYEVDVTWPRDMGGETERKSITLHADRTQFTLPFFHQFSTGDEDNSSEKTQQE